MKSVSYKWGRSNFTGSAILVGTLLLATAVSASDSHSLGIQGGWWVLELEYRTPFGLFIDVGVPWNTIAIDEDTELRPFEIKLGYQFGLDKYLRMRVGVRFAWFGKGDHFFKNVTCTEDAPDCGKVEKNLVSFEVGLRLEFPSGLAVGLEIPLLIGYHFDSKDPYYLLAQVLFSQIYIGYEYRF